MQGKTMSQKKMYNDKSILLPGFTLPEEDFIKLINEDEK